MSFGTDVPDGAIQRHSRIMELLTFINTQGQATQTQIQAHMLESPWRRGYPLETRLSIYSELLDVAKDHGVATALCKETPEVRKRLQLTGKCNYMS